METRHCLDLAMKLVEALDRFSFFHYQVHIGSYKNPEDRVVHYLTNLEFPEDDETYADKIVEMMLDLRIIANLFGVDPELRFIKITPEELIFGYENFTVGLPRGAQEQEVETMINILEGKDDSEDEDGVSSEV